MFMFRYSIFFQTVPSLEQQLVENGIIGRRQNGFLGCGLSGWWRLEYVQFHVHDNAKCPNDSEYR